MAVADSNYGLISKTSSSGTTDITINRYAGFSVWPYSTSNAFLIKRISPTQSSGFITPPGAVRVIDAYISPLVCANAQLCTKGFVSGVISSTGDRVVMSTTPTLFKMCWTASNQCFLACNLNESWRYVFSAIPSDYNDGPVSLVSDPSQANRYFVNSATFSKEGWGTNYTSSVFFPV